MTIRTQLKAGGVQVNHNEALQVRSMLKAARVVANHSDALRVRTALKAGGSTRSIVDVIFSYTNR